MSVDAVFKEVPSFISDKKKFIRLQGLAAGTVSGRNNGLLHWSMEFDIREKNEISYRSYGVFILRTVYGRPGKFLERP